MTSSKNPFVTKKTLVVSAVVVASLAVLAGGVYYTWLNTPPGMPDTADQALATIGTSRFENMPEYRQEAYLSRTNELLAGMSEDQRRAMFDRMRTEPEMRRAIRSVRQNALIERATRFAAAPSYEEKLKILDEDIDRTEAMRARFAAMRRQRAERGEGQARRPGPPGGSDRQAGPDGERQRRPDGERGGDRRGGRRGRMRERIQRRFESGNPQRNSLMAEYFRAMRERREQRGLSGGRGGRGGHGGRGRR